jgi:AIPR protein
MAARVLRASARTHQPNSVTRSTAARRPKPAAGRVLTLKAGGFKPHPSPGQRVGADGEPDGKENYQQFSFKVLADMRLKEELGDDVLSETGWARVNPRGCKLVGPVMDAVEETWKEFPSEFYRINRGIVLTAESVTWDKATQTVEIVFTDQEKHGVLDGRHSLAKIVEELIPWTYGAADESEDDDDPEPDPDVEADDDAKRTPDRYISCEVWVGLSAKEVVRLSAGRNTSRPVPPYAIANLRGDFRDVEATLEKAYPDYFKVVAFKPHQHMQIESETDGGEQNFRPVSALSILQLMMCMDVTNYTETDQPIEAYKNQGFIPKFWDKNNERNRIAEYKKMLPVLGDLLELYDTIRETIPAVYDDRETHLSKIPRRWNKVLAKKKQRVDKVKREPLYFLDPTGERKTFRSPTAIFYPIICAFRACLRVKGDRYEWFGGKKPTDWKEPDFHEACVNLAVTIAALAKDKDSLHAVGRDEGVWVACYKTMDSFLYKYGIKSRNS